MILHPFFHVNLICGREPRNNRNVGALSLFDRLLCEDFPSLSSFVNNRVDYLRYPGARTRIATLAEYVGFDEADIIKTTLIESSVNSPFTLSLNKFITMMTDDDNAMLKMYNTFVKL